MSLFGLPPSGIVSLRALAAIAVILVVALIALGPRPEVDETISFDFASIGDDVEQYLAAREAAVPGLKPGAEKEIVWADPATRARTPLAVVYVHGFSATKWEMRPLPDEVARGLGANLFLTRLTGHGQDGEALAAASMNDWINDIAEAIAIGEKIGDRVLLIGTSTGGTLATWASGNERLINKLVGMVLISPNFQIQGVSVDLLNMPWGNRILPLFFGDTRSFEPVNERQAQWWTTSYPSRAVFSMAALMLAVEQMEQSDRTVPTLFILAPDDQVVSPVATRRIYSEWGGPKEIFEVENSGDPSHHVIAGDILSPGTTDPIVQRILAWAATLKR